MPSSTLALAFAAAAVPFELASALIVIEPLLVMVLLAPPVPANALSLMPSMTEAVALPLVALALAPIVRTPAAPLVSVLLAAPVAPVADAYCVMPLSIRARALPLVAVALAAILSAPLLVSVFDATA